MKLLRVLHLEDSTTDALFIRRTFERDGFATEWNLAGSSAEFMAGLKRGELDLILVDHGVPGFSGVVALDAAKRLRPEVPFIFISGAANETQVRAAINAGAADYVVKDHLWQLMIILRRLFGSPAARDRVMEGGEHEKHDRAMRRLVAVVQELSLARNLEAIRAIVRRAARELTGADGATFVLRDGDKCHYFDEDAIGPLWKGQKFPLSACISGWVMLNRQPAVIPDIYVDPRIPVDAYRPTFVKSLVMVPIRTSAPIGAIGNYWATPHCATPDEVELLQALANTTAVAMENAQLYAELEQRVQDRTLQLEAANRELEAFSYSVSHDLRAPLRSITGFASLLEESGGMVDDGSRNHLSHIQDEARRMTGLIDDLLRLAQFSRGELRYEPVSLSEMARRLAGRLQANAPERKAEFVIQDGLEVRGDAGLLTVVLENLLSNAWKYSAKREAAVIRFGALPQADGTIAYFVRDNGAGFDMQYAGRLFAPFQRLHRAEEFAGTGVGLATVQRVIHRHGGRIWAEAEPGKGATFFFTLPQTASAKLD